MSRPSRARLSVLLPHSPFVLSFVFHYSRFDGARLKIIIIIIIFGFPCALYSLQRTYGSVSLVSCAFFTKQNSQTHTDACILHTAYWYILVHLLLHSTHLMAKMGASEREELEDGDWRCMR